MSATMRALVAVMTACLAAGGALAATMAMPTPDAIAADPPRDAAHPARMEVLHVPIGTVSLNAVAYLAAGAGPHPTLVLLHGLPGNEKNLDLAQAVRRAGWNVVTPNYRGSWGSPGTFRFAGNLEDARAVLAYLRDPPHAQALGIDTRCIVLGGHSMGGWVTAMTAERDSALAGAILISAANMGARGKASRAEVVTQMADNYETLAATAEQMADELIANAAAFDWTPAAAGLAAHPLLVLTSEDGLAPAADALVAKVRAAGSRNVATAHAATDHGWSDKRIRLETAVITWLQALPAPPR